MNNEMSYATTAEHVLKTVSPGDHLLYRYASADIHKVHRRVRKQSCVWCRCFSTHMQNHTNVNMKHDKIQNQSGGPVVSEPWPSVHFYSYSIWQMNEDYS